VETNGCGSCVSQGYDVSAFESTYNLELNWHDAEVDQLYCGPDKEVRLECWHVDVLELALDGALAAAFADGHECEEAPQTWIVVSTQLYEPILEVHNSPTGAKIN
jgi:hypothetical protein